MNKSKKQENSPTKPFLLLKNIQLTQKDLSDKLQQGTQYKYIECIFGFIQFAEYFQSLTIKQKNNINYNKDEIYLANIIQSNFIL